MALQPDSELAKIVANMRTATAEHNPFTTPESVAMIPDEADRAAFGEASVQLLQGLASLIELYPLVVPNLAQTGADVAGLLSGIGAAVARAGAVDEAVIAL